MKATELLAIYGALLSTIVFAWNVRRSSSRIRVDLLPAVDEYKGETCGGVGVSIKNPSSNTVHLAHLSLLYPWDKVNVFGKLKHMVKYRRVPRTAGWVHTGLGSGEVDDGLPLSLESGQSHYVFVPDVVLKNILEDSYKMHVRVVVQDQLWRSKYSNTCDCDWLGRDTGD